MFSIRSSAVSRGCRALHPRQVHRPLLRRAITQAAKLSEEESGYPTLTEAEDPAQNGGYQNPPFVKRQFRDPHGDWWDKQERRRYGEPMHEADDELQMFSLHEYTFTTPGKAIVQISCFVAAVMGLCGLVVVTYPDKPSAPRQFEAGLDREYGGSEAPGALAKGADWTAWGKR